MEAVEEQVTPTSSTESTQETKFVSPTQYREMQAERRHFSNLMKKRQERWNQPFSNAKIEDIQFLLEKLNETRQSLQGILYQNEVTRKALFAKGLITKEDIADVIERDNIRFEKAKELRENTEMSVDEKKAIAQEFDIPLEVIGLEEPTIG